MLRCESGVWLMAVPSPLMRFSLDARAPTAPPAKGPQASWPASTSPLSVSNLYTVPTMSGGSISVCRYQVYAPSTLTELKGPARSSTTALTLEAIRSIFDEHTLFVPTYESAGNAVAVPVAPERAAQMAPFADEACPDSSVPCVRTRVRETSQRGLEISGRASRQLQPKWNAIG